MKPIWFWRAWVGKERIADCGSVFAANEAEAFQIARMILGGPHHLDVTHIDVEHVANGVPTDKPRRERFKMQATGN